MGTGLVLTYTFPTAAATTVRLRVVDPGGLTGTATIDPDPFTP
jgi:hypothetical protein